MQCEIVRRFFELIDALTKEQKTPRDYGTGHLLYHSEVALLETIENHPERNVSDLAAMMNVTKSAVTQLTSKLFEKGLIEKYTIGNNKKEKFFRLSEAGLSARKGHDAYHTEANEKMKQYLCSLDSHEKSVLMSFFNQMEECSSLCVFPCRCGTGCDTMLPEQE